MRKPLTEVDDGNGADDETAPELPSWLKRWLWLGLLAFVAWGVFVAQVWRWMGLRHEWFGQWGDSFGPLIGIASTLAVVLTAWSVNMQRRDLRLQREQLRLTREELKAQRLEMEAQRIAQEKSAAAQETANRIADLANALEVRASIAAVYAIVANADDGSGTALAVLHKHWNEGLSHLDELAQPSQVALEFGLHQLSAVTVLAARLESKLSGPQDDG